MRFLLLLSLSLLAIPLNGHADPCSDTEECKWRGLCKFIMKYGEPKCVKTARGCRRSIWCKRWGSCGFDKKTKECVATARGCKRSDPFCKEHASCGFDKKTKECVETARGCRRSLSCKEEGWCGFDKKTKRCVKTTRGCARSLLCKKHGHCELEEEVCEPNTLSNIDNSESEDSTDCDFDPERTRGACVATARSCLKSSNCKDNGMCILRESDDKWKCLGCPSDDCGRYGKCSFVDGECKLTKDEDCAKTWACRRYGDCSLVDGECKLTKDEDCAKTWECGKYGKCSFVDGECCMNSQKDFCVKRRKK